MTRGVQGGPPTREVSVSVKRKGLVPTIPSNPSTPLPSLKHTQKKKKNASTNKILPSGYSCSPFFSSPPTIAWTRSQILPQFPTPPSPTLPRSPAPAVFPSLPRQIFPISLCCITRRNPLPILNPKALSSASLFVRPPFDSP